MTPWWTAPFRTFGWVSAAGPEADAGRSPRALRAAGVTVTGPADRADSGVDVAGVDVAGVDVYVFVETLNADDRVALASAARPTVAVLNKADLAGFRGIGPMTRAAARCRELQRATAVPTRPLSALLAVAGTDPAVLDSTVVDALRNLAAAPTRVTEGMRRRLATDLDLFGTACAVSAVRSGAGRDAVADLLRAVSGLGELCAEIDRAAATVRYRRLTGTPAPAIADDAVLARMAAAAAVVRAAGIADPEGASRSDHLRRAIQWQRYARGPVSSLHRACALDIARGFMRLWVRAGGVPGR